MQNIGSLDAARRIGQGRIGFDRREIGFDAVPQGLVLMQGALRDAFAADGSRRTVRVEVRT